MVPVFDKSMTEPNWNLKAYILKVQRRESAIALKKILRKTTKYSKILVKENIIHACIFDTRTTEPIWNLRNSNCIEKIKLESTKYSNILVKPSVIHDYIFATRSAEPIWNLKTYLRAYIVNQHDGTHLELQRLLC